MNKPSGIFTPYLDLDEHLLWMVERKQGQSTIDKRRLIFLYLVIAGLGIFLGGFLFDSGSITTNIFRVIGTLIFIFIAIEHKYQLLMPSTVWYGLTTKRIMIRFPSRIKQLTLVDSHKIIGTTEKDGVYAVTFYQKSSKLIINNLLIHQIRQLIPLLQEYTSADIEMPKLPVSTAS